MAVTTQISNIKKIKKVVEIISLESDMTFATAVD